MAETVGVAASVITVATSTCQAVTRLYNTVQSYRSHQQRVRDLLNELDALRAVLESLLQFLSSGPARTNHGNEADLPDTDHDRTHSERPRRTQTHDFGVLELPVIRCGDICTAFEEELLKCAAKDSTARQSLREWAGLRFMGDDVDGFRRGLAGYKLTISIALTDATLRTTCANGEGIARFNEMLNSARADLEDRLCSIDDKLECMLARDTPGSGVDAQNMQIIERERVSTKKCLEICIGLSRHIDEIHAGTSEAPGGGDEASMPNHITYEGLQGCKASLAKTMRELTGLERRLIDEMIARSAKDPSTSNDLVRLREQREATQQAMEICASAREYLKESVSDIENFATGNAVQFMASTDGRTIRGKNKGFGAVTAQAGGTYEPSSFGELCKVMTAMNIDLTQQKPVDLSLSPRTSRGNGENSQEHRENRASKFDDQYGKGFPLSGKDEAEDSLFQSKTAVATRA